MKKVFLSFLCMLSLTIMGHAVNPANFIRDTVVSMNLGANNDTIPEFRLGHVNFLADNSGSPTYKNGWIRNTVEWCLYRSYNNGSLLVKADAGYWIKDVTFYYSNCKSGGMLADTIGESQKKIAAYDSAKAIVVNGPEKQFYVGKTSKGEGGYLSFTKFAVTYCQTPDSLALEDMTVKLGEAFQLTPQTFPAGSDTIYSWRSDNSEVVSIDQNGVLTAKEAGEATIWVAAGALKDSCTVTVMPDSSVQVVETFSRCMVEKNFTGTTDIVGDRGLYHWKVSNYQRVVNGTEDKVGGKQGIRVRYDGSIKMDSLYEGGIKAVAFDWCTLNSTDVVSYRVKVGEMYYDYNSGTVKKGTAYHFERHFEVKENAVFSFDMPSKFAVEGPAYVVVGPVSITPYLLFTPANHRDTISMGASGTYDLNRVLINNTDTLPRFSVVDNTTGASDTIIDGVLTVTGKTQRGKIIVEASWNKVSTTMTLYVENMPDVHFERDTVRVDLLDGPFINPISVPDSVGAITYTSSNPAVAMVDSDGVVTPIGAGETTITAHVAAGKKYGPTEKTYVTIVMYQPITGESIVETFSNCRSTEMFEGRVHVIGDRGIYDWAVSRFQRKNPDDLIADEQGIRIRYDGSIASTSAQEGGVKAIAFDWRTTGPGNPVHFTVQVDSLRYEYISDSIPVTTVMHYVRPCVMAKNAEIKISVPSKEDPAQTYVVVGEVSITPYILFTVPNHEDTLHLADTVRYDLYEHLIDNTDSVGVIRYEIVSDATGVASLDGSVITMGEVEKSGEVAVKATWGEVTTTMTLWVEAEEPSGLTDRFTDSPIHPFTKVIQDGQIRICRGSECYTILGQTIY